MRIGVLALQGAFIEHIEVLHQLGAAALPVRLPGELDGLDGLILPGGESTVIGQLMRIHNLKAAVQSLVQKGFPLFGTCAGMILLAKKAGGLALETLSAIDIEVRRNAFGRQVDSFEIDLSLPVLGETPFHAVFIRAPVIERVGAEVDILARLPEGNCVAARQGRVLVSAFHPELTSDRRFHQYFLDIIAGIS